MNILKKPLLQLTGNQYLSWVILIAPLLNFISGINIDLYAPSLPSIAHHFQTTVELTKNTIAITMLGFSLGCIIFGTIIDIAGRRQTILSGLIIYIATSLLALFCHNITELMIVRFFQGMMVASVSIGARTLVVDHFTGKKFAIAMAYTSMTYGAGPVIAPFIGGILQFYFGWKADFVAYALFGILLAILFALLIQESIPCKRAFRLQKVVAQYLGIIKHRSFMAGAFILSMIVIEQMIYPTIGPFIVENRLHRSVITYGNSALLVGASYLIGTLVNRLLIQHVSTKNLASIGFTGLIMGVSIQILLAISMSLSLFSLTLPLLVIGFSLGWIFPNILVTCLSIFPSKVGIASAVQAFTLTLIGAIGVSIISVIHITLLSTLCWIYVSFLFIQCALFFGIVRNAMNDH